MDVGELTRPMLPRPIQANWGAIVASGVVIWETQATVDQSGQGDGWFRAATTDGASPIVVDGYDV